MDVAARATMSALHTGSLVHRRFSVAVHLTSFTRIHFAFGWSPFAFIYTQFTKFHTKKYRAQTTVSATNNLGATTAMKNEKPHILIPIILRSSNFFYMLKWREKEREKAAGMPVPLQPGAVIANLYKQY